MSEQILYASDVNIKTATIEVKVMKIGNRQVTLAVFRQLPNRDIIDYETGKLRGIPWGRVNYHVGCDSMRCFHLHVVWQFQDELRRAIAVRWSDRNYARFDLRGNMLPTISPICTQEQFYQNWQQSYSQLEVLDQLFIAV